MPSTAVKPIPDGYTAVTPYLTVRNAAAAIEFYKNVFGAEEALRFNAPDGRVGHAEVRVGGAVIMLHDEDLDRHAPSPQTVGDSASAIMLYVPDVDAVIKRALEAGATSTMQVADQFYGDRSGGITDPFGHKWYIATHIEDVPPQEMERRAAQLSAQQGQQP